VSSPEASLVIPVFAGPPAISLAKHATVIDANHNGVVDVGDEVAWTFLVTNTGHLTLRVAVHDPRAGSISCPATTLAPGASTTCTADKRHVLTQADFDAGSVSNTAPATGTVPGGNSVTSPPSTATVPLPDKPALELVKLAKVVDSNHDGRNDPGDTVL